ncbi:unnamed protein product, partial [Rotaria sp. Silwood2]
CCIPGYFRLSLTANEHMIEKSQYGFEQAYQQAISSSNDNNENNSHTFSSNSGENALVGFY